MSKIETKGTGPADASKTEGYWQDVENKVLDPEALNKEFPDGEFDSFSVEKSRRSFLKIMGFSVTALPLTGCIKIPVRKAIPYLHKNDTVIPGVANWYASTWKGTPILVKTREGRPIKIEGNDKSSVTMGGVDSQGQASVLSLYDSNRFNGPQMDSKSVEWDQFDKALKADIAKSAEAGKEFYIVTPGLNSPSEISVIEKFSSKFGAKHISYEPSSQYSAAKANEMSFGKLALNEYNFKNANVIVSFEADFLGTWGNNIANTKQYSSRRNPKNAMGMNKHIQIEASMSLTGSNADYRYTRSTEESRNILLSVLKGITGEGSTKVIDTNSDVVSGIVKELKANIGKSLVISGDRDIDAQVIVNKINQALGSYGSTLNVANNKYATVANDADFNSFVTSMNSGEVGVAFFIGTNPVYDYFDSAKMTSGIAKVATSVSFAMSADETSSLCKYVAASNHNYESWSDTQVSGKELSFTQPVIQALFGTRMYPETLLSLMDETGSFHDYIKAFWAKNFFTKQSALATATDFWNKSLHDGVVSLEGLSPKVNTSSFSAKTSASKLASIKYGTGLNIVTYRKSTTKDGDMANNPWLQECPDPITKATWDNYAMVSPAYAKEKGIKSGDVVTVKSATHTVTIPAIVQPGTAKNTIAIAVGYGRKVAGKVAKNLGGNAFGFNSFVHGSIHNTTSFGSITKTGKFKGLAQTQTHHSMEGRDIVRETTFAEYAQNSKSGNEKKAKIVHIYPPHKKDGHQWAMTIDLTTCTGCSSCIISCNAENNVPVVGRQEVANRREMHWMRLDRYYKGDENQPEVMHMPMLCQHCENAPCENVCPVMATVHSSDGLNQQVYNRCVGTRYCANNCPYKVRRFNWFNYDRSDKLSNMVLNPDVSTRSRGIMEKCSMCIQRIQEGKLEAKRERRDLKDGDIKLACQQSCPAEDGIVFGDMNDKDSKISKHIGDDRNYAVLEELNVQPRVTYMTKIRNK